MKAILDTSAYSAFGRGHKDVRFRLTSIEEVYVSPITIAELLSGFMGGARRDENDRELDRFLSQPHVKLVTVADTTARRYAVIAHDLRVRGTPLPANDIWIAASAMEWGLEILTTDEHFLKIPQVVVQYIAPEKT